MSDNLEKVTGIGGIFFKARDTERMSAWYREDTGGDPIAIAWMRLLAR